MLSGFHWHEKLAYYENCKVELGESQPWYLKQMKHFAGMPTIRDEDSENPDFEENSEVVDPPPSSRYDPLFYITSMGETESES